MTTQIDQLPARPNLNDPSTFELRTETLLEALDPWAVQVQAVGNEAEAAAVAAAESAVAAAASAVDAVGQVVLATTQATAAAGSALVAGAVAWVSGTTYAVGDCRYSPINLQTYRRRTNGAGTTDPSADSTNWAKAIEAGISNIVTATGSTTFTSMPTLLQITPASYGVAVTLPDATTCSEGGPLHIIDNRGGYPVRILNSAGTLLGFVFGGIVSHVSLVDNATTAGTWTIGNSERVGQVAQLTAATNLQTVEQCVDIGSSRELLMGRGASPYYLYAVVYDKATNGFGPVTLVRAANFGSANCFKAISAGTDKVLVISCPNGSTAFESVVLSISGTNIAVGTVATATLSANHNGFPQEQGLVAVGSSFVSSFYMTGAQQIRALTVSGTTVAIGSATALSGTAGCGGGSAPLFVSGSVVIVASYSTSTLYVEPFTVSGTTLTPGTSASTSITSGNLYHVFTLGTRWAILYTISSTVRAGIFSLSGTTVTLNTVQIFSAGVPSEAVRISDSKVLVTNNQSGNNANILIDTAGTPSVGTGISLSSGTSRAALYVTGTTAVMHDSDGGTITYKVVDCSGASPVLSKTIPSGRTTSTLDSFGTAYYTLRKSPDYFAGTRYAYKALSSSTTLALFPEIDKESFRELPRRMYVGGSFYFGTLESERWAAYGDAYSPSIVTKLECVQ